MEVVRLVCRNTIEEQIQALGRSKLALDEKVAGVAAEEGAPDPKVEAQCKIMVEAMVFDKIKEETEGKQTVQTDG